MHALLLRAAQGVDLVVLLAHVGQLGLDAAQDVFELGVADQPGVLAKLLQQPQLGQAALDVLGAGVGLLEGAAPLLQQLGAVLVARGVGVLGRVEVLVALQVDARQLRGRVPVEAGVLALDEVGKVRCVLCGGNECGVQVGRVDAGASDVGVDGCARCCQGGMVELGVDVCSELACGENCAAGAGGETGGAIDVQGSES